jgi:beta-phosphoglucomutase
MLKGVIFDLDGVIVATDDLHYQAWQRLADEEGVPFDRTVNERLRGVSRMESLAILLEASARAYSEAEKSEMAARKNSYYRALLDSALSADDLLPGVLAFLEACRAAGLKLAIGSSSRNSPTILKRIGLDDYFDATADGNDITLSKPAPEVFLVAAERLGLAPADCLVVEDAEAGVTAALAAGMPCVAVGFAARDSRAALSASGLEQVSVNQILNVIDRKEATP